ncbi:hypothetical protein EVAR_66353_1 [Eumeta japonica]|uniref:Uncharacterized protein n=1 Tax=Eumeta variegata TaxID=151549 RepID=A0A4C1ZUW5_EUMVA|nr:hypothetical protein EVAR_66353_1 [Eumeta japonica]
MILRNTLRKWTRTVGEGNTIDEIVLPVLVPQKLFGFQILDASWKWKTHGWYIVLCVSLSIYMIAGSVAVIADGNVDLDIKNESPYVIILALINPIKAIVFVGNRETFQVLYLTAKTTLYSFVETASKTKGEKLLKSIKTLVCCVIGVTLIPVLQYQVTFFWKYANGEKILLSRSTYLLIPMERPYYEIASLMQNLFLLEAACIVMLLDTWFAFYALILCYACDTLCELLAVRPPEDQENRSQYVHRLDVSLKSFYRNHVIINE